MKKKKLKDVKKLKKKTKLWIIVTEIIVALILMGVTAYLILPRSAKMKMIQEFTKCAPGRALITCIGKDDYVNNVMNKNYNRKKVKVNKGVKKKEGYTNIALFGVENGVVDLNDRGTSLDKAHSDVIIIVSINNKTSEVRMASIYRDTVVQLPMSDDDTTKKYNRCNVAYFTGGPENAVAMLNLNFDLDITDYAVVNFNGIATIIDALGGIDANITDDELVYVNGYLTETRKLTGMDAPDLTHSGQVHMNGLQATAYCRIRYANFYDEDGTMYHSDFGRTARQRFVLKQLLAKAKSAGVTQLMDVAETVLKNSTESGSKIIETSLPWDDVLDLIPVAVECNLTNSTGFPSTDLYTTTGKGTACYGMLVPYDLSHIVKELHMFLYDKEYTPSSAVKSISQDILNYAGVYYTEPETTSEELTSAYAQ